MDMSTKFSFYLIGGFLLLSSLVPLSSSYSNDGVSSRIMSRRLLQVTSNIRQFLVPHNKVRAEHGLPPLKWSKKLANYASWWTKQRQGDCGLIHSNGDYGENLFRGGGKDWKPSDAVAAWAEEKRNYNRKTNRCINNKECLHYTQMIWRNSKKVCCARVVCRSGDTLISCNYDPPGNVVGEKPF